MSKFNHPPLEGEGRERSERGGVIGVTDMNTAPPRTPTRSRFARSTSPLQGEVNRWIA